MTTLTVPDGANLVAFIREAAGASDAWVSAVGLVADVTLAPSIETKTLARTISERVLLLSLQGTHEGPLFVTLGVSSPDGMTVTGGVLEKAVSLGVTVYVETPRVARHLLGRRRNAARVGHVQRQGSHLPAGAVCEL